MAKESMDLLGLLRKRAMDADMDFLREAMGVLVQAIMEAEVVAKTGAGYGERTADRLTQRNGYRLRPWDTRVGTLDLHIPKLREGSYFPSLLEPRRRSDRSGSGNGRAPGHAAGCDGRRSRGLRGAARGDRGCVDQRSCR